MALAFDVDGGFDAQREERRLAWKGGARSRILLADVGPVAWVTDIGQHAGERMREQLAALKRDFARRSRGSRAGLAGGRLWKRCVR